MLSELPGTHSTGRACLARMHQEFAQGLVGVIAHNFQESIAGLAGMSLAVQTVFTFICYVTVSGLFIYEN